MSRHNSNEGFFFLRPTKRECFNVNNIQITQIWSKSIDGSASSAELSVCQCSLGSLLGVHAVGLETVLFRPMSGMFKKHILCCQKPTTFSMLQKKNTEFKHAFSLQGQRNVSVILPDCMSASQCVWRGP